MKTLKTILAVFVITAVLGSSVAVFAANEKQSPIDVLVNITNYSVEEIKEQVSQGKRLGLIAEEAGHLEAFKEQMLAIKKLRIEQRVIDGKLSQEQADKILQHFEEKSAVCDGTGGEKIGRACKASFGEGPANGMGLKRNGPQGKKGSGENFKMTAK